MEHRNIGKQATYTDPLDAAFDAVGKIVRWDHGIVVVQIEGQQHPIKMTLDYFQARWRVEP